MWQEQLENDIEMTNAVTSKSPKETQGLSFIRIVKQRLCIKVCVEGG